MESYKAHEIPLERINEIFTDPMWEDYVTTTKYNRGDVMYPKGREARAARRFLSHAIPMAIAGNIPLFETLPDRAGINLDDLEPGTLVGIEAEQLQIISDSITKECLADYRPGESPLPEAQVYPIEIPPLRIMPSTEPSQNFIRPVVHFYERKLKVPNKPSSYLSWQKYAYYNWYGVIVANSKGNELYTVARLEGYRYLDRLNLPAHKTAIVGFPTHSTTMDNKGNTIQLLENIRQVNIYKAPELWAAELDQAGISKVARRVLSTAAEN